MEDFLSMPNPDSHTRDKELTLPSPPMIVQSPHSIHPANTLEDPPPSLSIKRTRADIATPRKPGSVEARAQEESAYINTPARAPSSTKRPMRAESPLGFKLSIAHDEELEQFASRGPLMDIVNNAQLSPPKFALAAVSGPIAVDICDDMLAECEADKDADSSSELADECATASDTVGQIPETSEPVSETMNTETAAAVNAAGFSVAVEHNAASVLPECAYASDQGAESDSDIEFSNALTHAESDSEIELAVTDVQPGFSDKDGPEEMDCSAEAPGVPTPASPVAQPALIELASVFPALDDANNSDAPKSLTAPITRLEMPTVDHTKVERAELVTARILSDPELLYAASIPLPRTPAMAHQSTPGNKKNTDSSDSADFYIPTSWLMNPGTATRNQQQRQEQDNSNVLSPTRNSASTPNSDCLIPVTPANQRLLDSLEIQWVSPRRVPKFSEVDVDAVRAEYEEKMSRQNELREMLLEALKEEYATNMRKQEDMADQALREAEELFQSHTDQRDRDFADQIRTIETNHSEDIARRDEDTRVQVAQLSREIKILTSEHNTLNAERDELRLTLDEYVATSSKLLEEKESEVIGLTRELGKLTLDRQRLQEQLGEAVAGVDTLNAERAEAIRQIDSLVAENARLEELSNALRNDVLVAEERTTKIKEHAGVTLDKANAEINSAYEQLNAVRQEAAVFKAQAAKADARLLSLQIQLESTKSQNQNLLALVDQFGGSA
ncbi:hypothetical protein GGI04_003143 [Coemansia thaxteri]|uniref:Transforming acidic coiled-coil-containing protein C-terminal domain-containing protein n=1 Tax=Coemansia thaxteri TaxID=2663907 RepID=A0A9W8EGU2_9FUNG|nr:hypothetical protein H4R26_004345 [Coemansia thaxteri]KAJ2002949.1 hypothetical protein GGI04_003143 [Coemansia thaxteri]